MFGKMSSGKKKKEKKNLKLPGVAAKWKIVVLQGCCCVRLKSTIVSFGGKIFFFFPSVK